MTVNRQPLEESKGISLQAYWIMLQAGKIDRYTYLEKYYKERKKNRKTLGLQK